MGAHCVSFDDPSDDDLFVFSGSELLISHHDIADLDWQEVAERSALDERRGLVVLQVTVLEDLIDEFILYLADEPHLGELSTKLLRQPIGPRLDRLERELKSAALMDKQAGNMLMNLRGVVERRNELAHGTLHLRPVGGAIGLGDPNVELEWVIINRRSRTTRRITMLMLREDLYEAIGCFTEMLTYVETFMERAPHPLYFAGGRYLIPPTP